MNLFKGNVTAAVFSSAPSMGGKPLRLALRRAAFEPINPKHDHERAAGFVEFERTNETEFQPSATDFGQWVLLQWRVDTLKVPAVKLRKALLEWAQSFEQKNGRAPGRRERAEQKVVAKQVLRGSPLPPTAPAARWRAFITGEFIVFGAGASVVAAPQQPGEERAAQRQSRRSPSGSIRALPAARCTRCSSARPTCAGWATSPPRASPVRRRRTRT